VRKFFERYGLFVYLLLIWVLYSLRYLYAVPAARHVFDAAVADYTAGPPVSNASYDGFFGLMGTTDVALWIGAFAVVALSRYKTPTVSANAPRILETIARGFDFTYSAWLTLAFSTLSSILWAAATLNTLMLLPKLSATLLTVLLVANITLVYFLLDFPLRRAINRQRVYSGQLDSAMDELQRRSTRAAIWSPTKITRGVLPSVESLERALTVTRKLKKEIEQVRKAMRNYSQLTSLFAWTTSSLSAPRLAATFLLFIPCLYPSIAWIVTSSICVTLIGAVYLLWFANRIALEISVPPLLSE
jgi:hypothetical protein